jgi:hypothetical protein
MYDGLGTGFSGDAGERKRLTGSTGEETTTFVTYGKPVTWPGQGLDYFDLAKSKTADPRYATRSGITNTRRARSESRVSRS